MIPAQTCENCCICCACLCRLASWEFPEAPLEEAESQEAGLDGMGSEASEALQKLEPSCLRWGVYAFSGDTVASNTGPRRQSLCSNSRIFPCMPVSTLHIRNLFAFAEQTADAKFEGRQGRCGRRAHDWPGRRGTWACVIPAQTCENCCICGACLCRLASWEFPEAPLEEAESQEAGLDGMGSEASEALQKLEPSCLRSSIFDFSSCHLT